MKPVLALGLSAFVLYSCANQKVQESSLSTKLDQIRQSHQMPGLATRVAESGHVVTSFNGGVRAVGTDAAVAANDKWHMGSCTKQMTALAVAQLIDEKKLRFDSKLSDVFPKRKLRKSIGAITIEQLLSHQSGLADVMDPEVKDVLIKMFDEGDVQKQRAEFVESVFKAKAHFAPGTNAEYSNSAYVVLGSVIEQLDGKSWEESINSRVFTKLGMKSCGFGAAGADEIENRNSGQQIAITQPWGHVERDGKLQSVSPEELDADNAPALGPAGTVHCSLDDVLAFYQEVMRDVRGESKILSKETQTRIVANSPRPPYAYNSMGRAHKSWAGGDALTMNGSNTLNFMSVVLVPNQNRIYLSATNSATPQAEAGVKEAMLLLMKASAR